MQMPGLRNAGACSSPDRWRSGRPMDTGTRPTCLGTEPAGAGQSAPCKNAKKRAPLISLSVVLGIGESVAPDRRGSRKGIHERTPRTGTGAARRFRRGRLSWERPTDAEHHPARVRSRLPPAFGSGHYLRVPARLLGPTVDHRALAVGRPRGPGCCAAAQSGMAAPSGTTMANRSPRAARLAACTAAGDTTAVVPGRARVAVALATTVGA